MSQLENHIYFAHGNGFPSLCYNQLLKELTGSYKCSMIDRIGHNPKFPVSHNWPFLVDELIVDIEKLQTPVIAVGHSLGGVLSVMACSKRPDLFRAIILLDSPLLGRVKSHLIKLSKFLKLINRITPAKRVQNRQEFWSSREEALKYFKNKLLFKNFTEECLNDYINYGLVKQQSRYSLWFSREIEYQIYRTLPHQLYQHEDKLSIPCCLIYGKQSRIIKAADIDYMQKHYLTSVVPIPGTHMFPMENPKLTADIILQWLEQHFF